MPRIPTHPGALLREDILPSLGMSVTRAARELKISRQMLHNILSEKAPITPEMAVRIGKFVGDGPGIWIRMQSAHDVAIAEREMAAIVKTIKTARAA